MKNPCHVCNNETKFFLTFVALIWFCAVIYRFFLFIYLSHFSWLWQITLTGWNNVFLQFLFSFFCVFLVKIVNFLILTQDRINLPLFFLASTHFTGCFVFIYLHITVVWCFSLILCILFLHIIQLKSKLFFLILLSRVKISLRTLIFVYNTTFFQSLYDWRWTTEVLMLILGRKLDHWWL